MYKFLEIEPWQVLQGLKYRFFGHPVEGKNTIFLKKIINLKIVLQYFLEYP